MLNATKLTVLASTVLTLVGVVGLVSMNASASPSPRQPATPTVEAVHASATWTAPAAEDKVTVLPEVIVEGKRPAKKPAKKAYVCGDFEPLQNDATQKVRRCEWK